MAIPPKLKKSRAQEARGAKLHGGTRNTGSGNGPWRKNDVRVDDEYLVEYKRTDKRSITIQGTDLEGVRTNALLEGRKPVFGVEILGRDWTLIETSEFERLRSGNVARDSVASSQVPGVGPGVHVSRPRPGEQEAARGSQAHLSRARRSRNLPDPGGMP